MAVGLEAPTGWTVGVFPDAQALWRVCRVARARWVLIDIPIGLRETGAEPRVCDVLARRFLGRKRASSVFSPPCRAALAAKGYREACAMNEQPTGRRLSRQAWGIVPKIREVDELVCADAHACACLVETHPELCFYALSGGRATRHAKRTGVGFADRLGALREVEPRTDAIVGAALAATRRREVARDDLLDALVLAVTAAVGPAGWRSLPDPPEHDAEGLPMRIVMPRLE